MLLDDIILPHVDKIFHKKSEVKLLDFTSDYNPSIK